MVKQNGGKERQNKNTVFPRNMKNLETLTWVMKQKCFMVKERRLSGPNHFLQVFKSSSFFFQVFWPFKNVAYYEQWPDLSQSPLNYENKSMIFLYCALFRSGLDIFPD